MSSGSYTSSLESKLKAMHLKHPQDPNLEVPAGRLPCNRHHVIIRDPFTGDPPKPKTPQ